MSEITTNIASLCGTVVSPPVFSHTHGEENFYTFTVKVRRLSDTSDYINATVCERLAGFDRLNENTEISLKGQFRSYNNSSGTGSRLILTFFVQEICCCLPEGAPPNSLYLNGYICKPPVYRTTPFGREITDIILAVNRPFGKSDYIPCIAWGRNAKFARNLSVGDNIEINGRIQSREYQKKISETEVVTKTAYEVSVTAINICT